MPRKTGFSNTLQTELIVDYQITTWQGFGGESVGVLSGYAQLVQLSGGVLATLPLATPKFNINVDANGGRLVAEGTMTPRDIGDGFAEGLVNKTKEAVKSGQPRAVSALGDLLDGKLPSGGSPANTLARVEMKPSDQFPGTNIPITGVESASDEVVTDLMFTGDSLTIRAVPTGNLMSSLSKFVSGQLNDFPEVTIEKTNPQPIRGPCEDLFSDLAKEINTVRDNVRDSLNAGDRRVKSLEDIHNEIVSGTGVGSRLSLSPPDGSFIDSARDIQFDPPSVRDLSISDIGEGEIRGMSEDKLEDLKARFRDIPSTVETGMSIDDMENKINDINDRIQNISDEECLKRFKEMMDNISQKAIEALRRMDSFIKEMKDRISTLLEGVDVGERIDRGVDCAQAIGTSLRNRISNFQQDVSDFQDAPGVAKSRDRFNNLLQEGNEILQQTNRVPDECEPRVKNPVETALSQLRSEGIRSATAIPCGDKHEEIFNRVRSFREKAENARSASAEEIKDIVEDGRDLAEDIERNVPSGECKDEFLDTMDGSLSRLRSFTREVRIFTGDNSDRENERQEVLNQIRTSIAQIQQSLGGDFDVDREGFGNRD